MNWNMLGTRSGTRDKLLNSFPRTRGTRICAGVVRESCLCGARPRKSDTSGSACSNAFHRVRGLLDCGRSVKHEKGAWRKKRLNRA